MSELHEEEIVATKSWDVSLFRRLLEFAKPHRGLFVKCFLVLLSLFGLELVGAWIWKEAIDGPVDGLLRFGTNW